LQELGGKADYQCKESVSSFFRQLREPSIFDDYTCTCSYIDEECGVNAKYTALGCSYFVHKSLDNVELWNFNSNCFSPVVRSHQFHSISDDVGTIRKFKFPLSCFSKKQVRLPRKGFTWIRWKIQDRVVDMLNIHLSHDADNVYCATKSPTKYSKHRRRSFEYIFERLLDAKSQHQILFGDFNVRPDTKHLVEHIMENKGERILTTNEDGQPTSIVYRKTDESSSELQIEQRFFVLRSYEAFDEKNVPNIIPFDRELDWIKNDHGYKELPIKFQPTYPHKENPEEEEGTTFLSVRCPSWCDRVLIDSKLFDDVMKNSTCTLYDSFGKDIILGDHKPVFLAFDIP